MATADSTSVTGRPPTLEWLRGVLYDSHRELAEHIAVSLVRGSRYFSIEAYEETLARAAAAFPWMHITRLVPLPWEPVDSCGDRRPDVTVLSYRCAPEAPVAAGILSPEMVPQGRKRVIYCDGGITVEKGSPNEISVCGTEVGDELPDCHPLAMFRPRDIMASPWRKGRRAAPAKGLRRVEQASLRAGVSVPLAQVLCGGAALEQRDRAVGSRQRRVRWIANGNLIAPDWRGVRRPPGAG